MLFHPDLGPPPSVGLEFEVAGWKKTTMLKVAKRLVGEGFMDEAYAKERHDYNCRCVTCTNVDITYPPQWKMQRDASLPMEGAEFISTPFPATSIFIEAAIDAIKIITEDAKHPEDYEDMLDQRGNRQAATGLHVHVYPPGLDSRGPKDFAGFFDTLQSFVPELFVVAAANIEKRNRELEFRLPINSYKETSRAIKHHSWVSHVSGKTPQRFEWRLWEAPLQDYDYIRGCILLSAALSQVAVREEAFLRKLRGISILMSDDIPKNYVTTKQIFSKFSTERLEMLKEIVLKGTAVVDDDYSKHHLEQLFERVGA